MRRDYDNNGNPLHAVCINCKLWKLPEKGSSYCQRTRLITSPEDSCIYHVMKD